MNYSNKSREFFLLSAVFFGIYLLSGCGGGGPESSQTRLPGETIPTEPEVNGPRKTIPKGTSVDDTKPLTKPSTTKPSKEIEPPKVVEPPEEASVPKPMTTKPAEVEPPEVLEPSKPKEPPPKETHLVEKKPVTTILPGPAVVKPEVVDMPIPRGVKDSTKFTDEEKALDDAWVEKKRELSSIIGAVKGAVVEQKTQRERRTELAQEMNKLSDEQFAFLSTQTYFWSDLVSQDTFIFSRNLSPEKLSIAADVVVNKELIERDPNIPKTLEKLITSLNIEEDPLVLAKMKAFIKAANVSELIADAIQKQALPYRIKKKDKVGYDELMTKLNVAKAFRDAEAKKQKAMPAPQPKKEKQPSKWDQPVKAAPAVEKIKPITVDVDMIKDELTDWLNENDFTVDSSKLERYQKYLIAILKLYKTAEATTKEQMEKAFKETVAQHTVVTPILDVLPHIDPKEQKLFIELFPDSSLGLLWDWEIGGIITGGTVRANQIDRLKILFANLSKQQIENSFKVNNFWVLVDDQPEASAHGFLARHFVSIAEHFKKFPDRVSSFASKVVSKIPIEELPVDEAITILRALKPFDKNAQMGLALGAKKTAFQLAHVEKYGKAKVNEWMAEIAKPL